MKRLKSLLVCVLLIIFLLGGQEKRQFVWTERFVVRIIVQVRVGADSTGWWEEREDNGIGEPFHFQIEGFSKDDRFKKEVVEFKKLQELYIAEAKRLLPEIK